MDDGSTTNVFVYGTLKKGFYNYKTYLQLAIDKEKAEFVSNGTTSLPYRLVIADGRKVPCLLNVAQEGNHVHGEIYQLTDSVLAGLDVLEGISTGFYYRQQIEIQVANQQLITCWVYFIKSIDEDMLTAPCFDDYTAELHHQYLPRDPIPNPTILSLMSE